MSQSIARTVETAYRAHWGELTAILGRQFGAAHLDLVEAVVQDAFVKAMERWPTEGVPANPVAWLLTVARNLRLNQTRHARSADRLEEQVVRHIEVVTAHVAEADAAGLASEILDDQLRMMFVCNHPALPEDARIPLTLRTLCGFEARELARAYLVSEDALKKRLVRARAQLREAKVELDLPPPGEIAARVDSVLATLYLLFSEGYAPHDGDAHVRRDLAAEAMRLVGILADHASTKAPKVDALLALMCFQASRFDARADGDGGLLVLQSQDRSLWDQSLIRRGFVCLARSSQGTELSRYHIEASIAACHARAPTFGETDWGMIASLYEHLLADFRADVALVGHAIAIGYRDGAEAGLQRLAPLLEHATLRRYAPLHAATAEFHAALGRIPEARAALAAALQLVATEPERRYLQKRLDALT